MVIKDCEIREQNDKTEISADIDGFRLYYRVPKPFSVSRTGDPFLAAALLPAMLEGTGLEIDSGLPVSAKLLKGVSSLQEIHHCWNPVFGKISVCASNKPAQPRNPGVLSFFSGGVDSMYTFLRHRGDLTHIAFMHGFDFIDRPEPYKTAVERNRAFAQTFGKTLIPVETNHYSFGYRYNLSRNLTQGGALASVALLLGFPRAYIPSAYSYSQLVPLGSHPLTDPLYSNECVEIIHDGAEARRVDKVMTIAESPYALANLRVCFADMNVNCGRCAKCLRTMIPLALLGASSAPFPSLPSLKEIRRLKIDGEIERVFFEETLQLATVSERKDLRQALCSCLRRYERKRLLKEVDRVLLGGALKSLRERILKPARRIDSAAPKGLQVPRLPKPGQKSAAQGMLQA